jgi:hypothetical protein
MKMAQNQPRTATVSFKVETDLAEFLDRLPNKSEFIRKAIAAQLSVTCPMCSGRGQVTRGMHDTYARICGERSANCVGCGNELQVPTDPGELSPEDRMRLEQFFSGGPLYCNECFRTAPPCEECGWHVDSQRLQKHREQAHAGEKTPPT